MKAIILALGLFVVAASCVGARWGEGSCAVAQTVSLEWRKIPGVPDEAQLFRGNVQLGSWCFSERYYRPIIGNAWGEKQPNAPIAPPVLMIDQPPLVKVTMLMPEAEEFAQAKDPDLTDPKNFGVDWDKIADHQATYSGRIISCEKAIELVGKQVPDDSKKFRLTIIGTETEQKEALAQFAMLESEYRDRFNTWAVSADHWSLRDGAGQAVFHTKGNPVLYVQAPDGQVLHRQDDPKDLSTAIRKAVKSYDAAKDTDLRKPSLVPTGPINPALLVGGLLAAVVGFFYLKG